MNQFSRPWNGTILLLVMLCSCETSDPNNKPWIKGGQAIGSIEKVQRQWGWEYVYKSNSRQTLRLEKRNPMQALLPGACITTFTYSTNNQVEVERSFDAEENSCLNDDGYAISRFQYTFNSDGDPTAIEQTFFDLHDQPVMTRPGYARLHQAVNPNGQTTEIQFYDLVGKPVSATWLEVTNVALVKYVYLTGATEVTGAVFFDAAGNVLARKQVAGLTSKTTEGY